MIPATYRASFSYLLRHPWQLALALLGIGIGVAVIVAVDLANASARKAFLKSMDAVAGETTHQVIGGPSGVPEDVYVRLRVESGIRSIAPVVEGDVEAGETSMQLLGIDIFAERDMRTFTGEASGEDIFRGFLSKPGAVTMSEGTAARLGIVPGQDFAVSAAGKPHEALLLGTFEDESGSLDNLIIADIATAQSWLGREGYLTRIDARIADGDLDALQHLEAALPEGVRVLSAAGRSRATADMSAAFMTNLTAMSLLALLVGLFLIFNSVSFSVLQRRELIGILRALGYTRRQVFGLILAEALFLGAVAALLGVAIGIWLGEQLLVLVSRSINDLYFRVYVTDVSVDSVSIVKGLLAGIGASLVAAAAPALEATSYAPRLALTRSSLEKRAGRSLTYVAIAGLCTMLIATAVLAFSGRDLVAGLAAVFLLILGFSFCVPLGVRLASARLAPSAQRLGGTPARMAVAGIGAGLSRTGVAIVALAVAVSATIGVSVMVGSFRASVGDWLEQTLQADLYTGPQQGSMDPGLVAEISNMPGVEAVSTSRRAWIEDASGRTQLVAIKMAPGSYAGTEILDADPALVWPAWEDSDVVLVSEPYAYHKQVSAGDSITLPTDSGPRDFEVAASFKSYDINSSAVLMSRANYDRYFLDERVDSLGLYLDDDADPVEVSNKILQNSKLSQKLRVTSNTKIRDLSLEIFDQTFVITDVLYWLAIGVAFIGILGAMLALQLERAREFALLRALGMTPRQVGSMITGQTAVIGLLSGLAAVPLGVVMAWILIKVINRRAFGWQIDMQTTPDVLLTAVAFAVGASLLAGIYPAYRAAQSQPAVAMREE